MKRVPFFLLLTTFSTLVHSQKNISMEKLLSKRLEYLVNSTLEISDFPPLEIVGFYVHFTKAIFFKKSKVLKITGQLFENRNQTVGFPSAAVFIGYRHLNHLRDTSHLTTSSLLLYENNFNSGGHFEATIKVKLKMRLYFSRSFSYLREYNIGKLLRE